MFSRKSSFILFIAAFMLFACDSGVTNRTQPYVASGGQKQQSQRLNQPVSNLKAQLELRKDILVEKKSLINEQKELALIEAQTKAKIAEIDMQKEIEVQKIKNEGEIQKKHIDKEIAVSEHRLKKSISKEEVQIQKLWFIGIAVALFIVLFFIYLIVKKRDELRIKLEKEKMEHEKRLKEQELKVGMANKMLDALASGNISPQHQERLIDTFAGGGEKLLEDKTDETIEGEIEDKQEKR